MLKSKDVDYSKFFERFTVKMSRTITRNSTASDFYGTNYGETLREHSVNYKDDTITFVEITS